MASDYFLLVFVASIGVCQIAVIHAKLEGLWFFRSALIQYVFGVLAIVGAFGWFFTADERNVQHTVEGSQQLGLFLAAILSAYAVTAVLSSIIEARVGSNGDGLTTGRQHERGMETLKHTTVYGGIVSSLKKMKREKH
jgi:hypothetical protein